MGLSLVVIIVSMLCGGALAQTNSCTNSIVSMSPCVNYITGSSSAPTSGCCSALASLVRSSPACLCQVLNGSGLSAGMIINQPQTLALPGACNVQTPLLNGCTVVAAPAISPTVASSDAPDISPSESGSKTIPIPTTRMADDDGTSDGYATKLSASLLLFILIASSYASAFITC